MTKKPCRFIRIELDQLVFRCFLECRYAVDNGQYLASLRLLFDPDRYSTGRNTSKSLPRISLETFILLAEFQSCFLCVNRHDHFDIRCTYIFSKGKCSLDFYPCSLLTDTGDVCAHLSWDACSCQMLRIRSIALLPLCSFREGKSYALQLAGLGALQVRCPRYLTHARYVPVDAETA